MPPINLSHMKFTSLLFVILISFAASAQNACIDLFLNGSTVTRPLGSVKQIKMMAYNVENMFMRLGKFAKMPPAEFEKLVNSELKPDISLQGVAKAILDESPDFIVLEEVEDIETLTKFTRDYLGGTYRPFLVDGNDNRAIQIGYLVKTDLPLQVTLETHKDAKWKDPTDGSVEKVFSRDAPALMIRREGARPATPPALIFIGNHAKAQRDRGGDPGSVLLRTAQMKEIASIVDGYQKLYGSSVPIVLGGDFNVDVRKAVELDPIRTRMTDSFDVKGVRGLDRMTHSYHPNVGSTEFHQLDALYLTPGLQDNVVSIEAYRYKDVNGQPKPLPATFAERTRNPSDHFPIVVTLSTEDIFPEAYAAAK